MNDTPKEIVVAVDDCVSRNAAQSVSPILGAKEVAGYARNTYDSDSDIMSVASVDGSEGLWQKSRKRPLTTEEAAPPPVKTVVKRGRGRPTSIGKYSGLGLGRESFLKANRAEDRVTSEEEALDQLQRTSLRGQLSTDRVEDMTASTLTDRAYKSVEVITTVASKSRNLKGTFQRSLKDAAATLREVVEEMKKRNSSDETQKLQAANERLQAELADLREEFNRVKVELRKQQVEGVPSTVTRGPTKSPDNEQLTRDILLQVGAMMEARFDAVQDRLLPEKRIRPPLAADRRKEKTLPPPQKPKPGPALQASGASAPPKRPGTTTQDHTAGPSPGQGSTEGWNKVLGRKAKKAKQVVSEHKQAPKSKGPKIRTPSTAAVVITLQPKAAAAGATYAAVMSEARIKINPADLGIEGGVRFRVAATGARMLEVPGIDCAEKADKLANKLKESLGDSVKVSRPTKTVDLRVMGLDDSVTPLDVAVAMAREGGCPVEAIKLGKIRREARGLGTLWLNCPAEAAKKVSCDGRLVVGWASAQVKLLEPRPQQCYRCLQLGHVAALCTAETDRSAMCFRCGQANHKAADCEASPHCALCVASGKNADHRMGTKACTTIAHASSSSKKTRSRKSGKSDGPRVPSQLSRPLSEPRAAPVQMSVN